MEERPYVPSSMLIPAVGYNRHEKAAHVPLWAPGCPYDKYDRDWLKAECAERRGRPLLPPERRELKL